MQTSITTTIEPSDEDYVSEDSEENLTTQGTLLDSSRISDHISDTSDNTTDVDDYVHFPDDETNLIDDTESTTTEQTLIDENTTASSDENKTTPDPSLIVFKLKELLKEELSVEDIEIKENLKNPRQTRIVYINNQRVEIEDEELL